MKMRYFILGFALLIVLPALSGPAQSAPAAVQIDSISDQGVIVIGDMTFEIAPDAHFFAKDAKTPISFLTFKEGDWVEFSLNEDGEIDELWFSSEQR